MFKKLVAITLAALMLINPMTAMAVSWGEVREALITYRQFDEQDGISASVDEDGHVTVVGNDGSIENFFHSEEFKSYSFTGTIHFGGEEFKIYVNKNSGEKVLVDMGSDVAIHADKVDIQAEDGSTVEMGGDAFHVYIGGTQQTVVMIGDNVTVTSDVGFHAGENSSMTVTIDGDINNVGSMIQEYDEYGPVFDENGNPVEKNATVSFGSSENSSMTVTLNGTLETEDVHMSVGGTGTTNVENNGQILTQEQVGIYAGNDSEGTLNVTNNGEISVNLDTEDDIYEEGAEDDHIGGVMIGSWESSTETTVTNTADGVINGNVSGWLDNTKTGAGLSFTNEGAVSGEVGVWGNGGEGSINLENSGMIEGYFGTHAHDDISIKTSNSGTVEGEMFADNQSSKDMEMTNSGTTNGLSANNNGGATSTVINSGEVVGGEVRVEAGSGTMDFSNTGDINAERFDAHAYEDGVINGSNDGNIDVDWGYVGSSENGQSSFTNTGDIHTNENFDINAGNWPDDENYGGLDPAKSSSTSFVNSGNIVTEGSFSGNLFENGSVTLENTVDGTMTAVNEGIHISNSGNGTGSVSVSNAGTVNSEWFNVATEKGGEASISNSGTVNGYMGAYADGVWDEDGNKIQEGAGHVSISNSGTITDGMGANLTGTATGEVTNTEDGVVEGGMGGGAYGTGSMDVSNSGTVGNDIWIDIGGEASGSLNNSGDAAYIGANAHDEANINVENSGKVEFMDVIAGENSSATLTNTADGEVTGGAYVGAYGNASASGENNGFIEDFGAWAEEGGKVDATNNADIGFKYTGFAYGEGEVTITNTANGTVGDSVQDYDVPDGVWGQAEDGSSVIVKNEGDINGEIGGVAYGDAQTSITQTEGATSDTAWLNAHGGDLSFEDKGTVSGTLTVSIGTQSSNVTEANTVAQLIEQAGINISGQAAVDIYTVNPDGEMIARYSVDEAGKVELEEVLLPGASSDDGPENWTEERIRHKMEEKRKAAAIGGVYGSPYHLKQLYLGYMSLNLRLFDGEEQLLFKENVSWVPDTGKAGEKILTLSVRIEDTSDLSMRLDGMVINKLEQAGIVTINIVDGAGNLFMTYQVEDLKDAREMYGLTEKEYIVVGDADADVLKIAEDGTVSPIEGETEPVEEVAHEAQTAEDEEAVEETPAA